jgi:hypothetical protein
MDEKEFKGHIIQLFKLNAPGYFQLLKHVDDNCYKYLCLHDGISNLTDYLSKKNSLSEISTQDDIKNTWIGCALIYRYFQNQYPNALKVLFALYQKLIEYQTETHSWIHKGYPLAFIRDMYMLLNYRVLAKRFAMLTLIEDSIGDKKDIGKLKKNEAGIYFRLSFYHGMPDREIDRYFKEINRIYLKRNEHIKMFPERILQELDTHWMLEFPEPSESLMYTVNTQYIEQILYKVDHDDRKGLELEVLADYLLSSIPGFRTKRRMRSESTDYDVLCALEGLDKDFRSELWKYILVECKNWNKPADYSVISKFISTIESTRCKAGIIFSKKGITGNKNDKYARREVIKVYQRNGITLIVVDRNDLKKVAEGSNFVEMLRHKYEVNRFDLTAAATEKYQKRNN